MEQNKWIVRMKKMAPVLIVFIIAIGLSFLLPNTGDKVSAQMGMLSLMLTRMISASMGFAFAYLVKEWAFPCLSLTESIKQHHSAAIAFIAVWYTVCIYCFSLGG